MDSSFFSRAIEQAKQLQQIALDAAQKGIEQAKPLVQEGITKAHELQKTIVEQTPGMTAAAQQQANAALEHAGAFIATGKTIVEAGAAQAQTHLATFADQAKKAAEATVSAVQSATQKAESDVAGATGSQGPTMTPEPPSATGSAPPPGTGTSGGSSTPL